MTIFSKSEAKSGGYAQVRGALVSFEGVVSKATTDQWGGQLIDDDGKPVPPKEYFEVESEDNVVLEVTEELSVDIGERFSFRVNTSDYDGSFWVDEFLAAADQLGIQLPDGILGKRVQWKKITKQANNSKFNSTNFIPVKVSEAGAPRVSGVPVPPSIQTSTSPAHVSTSSAQVSAPPTQVSTPSAPTEEDLLGAIQVLAVGKTEQQFRSAIGLDPRFQGTTLLQMARVGVVTESLMKEGKLVLVGDVYQLP